MRCARYGVWMAAVVGMLGAVSAALAQTHYVTDRVLVGLYEGKSKDSPLIKVMPTGTPLEILNREDEFVEVRGPDGLTGWVEASYVVDRKPAQLVVLELADKQKVTTVELDAAREQLTAMEAKLAELEQAATKAAEPDPQAAKLSATNKRLTQQLATAEGKLAEQSAELEQLGKALADARAAEEELQAQLAAAPTECKDQQGALQALTERADAADQTLSETKAELVRVQQDNEGLRQRITAVLTTLSGGEPIAPTTAPGDTPRTQLALPALNSSPLLWWVLGIASALLAGFVAGVRWLDRRNVRRHGGFRI